MSPSKKIFQLAAKGCVQKWRTLFKFFVQKCLNLAVACRFQQFMPAAVRTAKGQLKRPHPNQPMALYLANAAARWHWIASRNWDFQRLKMFEKSVCGFFCEKSCADVVVDSYVVGVEVEIYRCLIYCSLTPIWSVEL
jgi:hypothetical protein